MFEFSAFGSTITIDSLTLIGIFVAVIAVSAIRYLCHSSGDCHCQNM